MNYRHLLQAILVATTFVFASVSAQALACDAHADKGAEQAQTTDKAAEQVKPCCQAAAAEGKTCCQQGKVEGKTCCEEAAAEGKTCTSCEKAKAPKADGDDAACPCQQAKAKKKG